MQGTLYIDRNITIVSCTRQSLFITFAHGSVVSEEGPGNNNVYVC